MYYTVSYKKAHSGRLQNWVCSSEIEALKMPREMVINNRVYLRYGITKHDDPTTKSQQSGKNSL